VLPFQSMSTNLEWQTIDPRFPIGPYASPGNVAAAERIDAIATLEGLPCHLRDAVEGLDDSQLDTPYREGGWTLRQVVHHVADSHMNAFSRFKFALTEDEPTIKTYDETRWAELADAKMPPIELSLALLENLHKRWVVLLRSLEPSDWPRKFRHPEWGLATVDFLLAQYAWHGRHHVAQITSLRERNGW